ncbi:hypothetical protein E4U41_005344, partial [Claviceps citrina]
MARGEERGKSSRMMGHGGDQQARPAATFRGRLHLDAFRYSVAPAPAPTTTTTTTTTTTNTTTPTPTPAASTPTSASTSASTTTTNKPPTRRRTPGPDPNPKTARYAPPSHFAHLPPDPLPDALAPNLLVLFIGLNPGLATARSGHAYAHPSNLFWKLLHASGITPRRCLPHEDRHLPALYSLGLTNIVARPSRNASQLRGAELDRG